MFIFDTLACEFLHFLCFEFFNGVPLGGKCFTWYIMHLLAYESYTLSSDITNDAIFNQCKVKGAILFILF